MTEGGCVYKVKQVLHQWKTFNKYSLKCKRSKMAQAATAVPLHHNQSMHVNGNISGIFIFISHVKSLVGI